MIVLGDAVVEIKSLINYVVAKAGEKLRVSLAGPNITAEGTRLNRCCCGERLATRVNSAATFMCGWCFGYGR